MKAIIQRVMNASVTVNGNVISSIERGICILIGITSTDTSKDIDFIVRKLLSIKLFDDEDGKRWKKNVVEKQFEILCVSQFTLYNTWKGTKPDFHHAMPGEQSKQFYLNFLTKLSSEYLPEKVKDGEFGAYMQVSIQNDGPVTFFIESPVTQESQKTEKNKQTKKSIENATVGDIETAMKESTI